MARTRTSSGIGTEGFNWESHNGGGTTRSLYLGAGAAGLMAAIFAADSGRRAVILLERTRDGGRKILISGGGRCNVLPSQVDPSQYVTASSANTLKKILRSWPLAEQRRFFETEVGIPLALEEESGKLFPASNRARDVRDALVELARARGVRCRFESEVTGLRQQSDSSWLVELREGVPLAASAVVIATGGLSVPATGSDGAGLRIARRLGHTVHDVYPALTPLTAEPPRHAALAGVSLEVQLRAPLRKGAFTTTGGFLFTHRGYSGPAVLNISHLAAPLLARGATTDLGAVVTVGRRRLDGLASGAGRRHRRERGTPSPADPARRHDAHGSRHRARPHARPAPA